MSTRDELLQRVKDKIDDIESIGSEIYSDTRIVRELQDSAQHVQGILERLDESYFETSTTENVTASQTSVNLPTGFRKLIDIRRTDNGNDIQVQIEDKRLRQNKYNIPTALNNPLYVMELNASTLDYRKAIGVDHTLTIKYTANIDFSGDNGNTDWGFPVEAEHVLTTYAAWMLIRAENSKAAGDLKEEYREMKQHLNDTLEPRTAQKPRYVNFIGDDR